MTTTETTTAHTEPTVGGRWTSYNTSHIVGYVETDPRHPHGTGWTPACDLRMKRWPLRSHGIPETPAGPSKPADRVCEYCAAGVQFGA